MKFASHKSFLLDNELDSTIRRKGFYIFKGFLAARRSGWRTVLHIVVSYLYYSPSYKFSFHKKEVR